MILGNAWIYFSATVVCECLYQEIFSRLHCFLLIMCYRWVSYWTRSGGSCDCLDSASGVVCSLPLLVRTLAKISSSNGDMGKLKCCVFAVCSAAHPWGVIFYSQFSTVAINLGPRAIGLNYVCDLKLWLIKFDVHVF